MSYSCRISTVRSARPGAVGDEQHRVAALARLTDVGDPVVDAAVELHRRLAATTLAGRGSPRRASSSRRGAPRARRFDVLPADERGRSGGSAATWPRLGRVAVARLELIANLARLLLHLLVLRDEQLARRRAAPRNSRHGNRLRSSSSNRSRTGTTSTWSVAPVERCVAGSNRRSDSTMSPTNSRRTGSASPAGKMSTMPPRMVNAPCSSTGSSRVKPASTSRSARSCGSISVPAVISIDARSRRSGGLTRGSSAAADATIRRAVPVAAA